MGVLLTPGQLDQPTDLAGELGFHFESVRHARHTEYACIGYAAQLNWRSIVTRNGKITNLGRCQGSSEADPGGFNRCAQGAR